MPLRIIGGNLKRRKLYTLAGKGTRPTADRLRESIFNIIAPLVTGAVALDLFAGTGAMGIEALSRGASFCAFVEGSNNAIEIIKKNIALCGVEKIVKIIRWDISKNLNCLTLMEQEFDLIFMDPPYNQNLICPSLIHLGHSQKLKTGASIVIEHSSLEKIPEDIVCFELVDQRLYGKTVVSILQYSTQLLG